MFTRFICNSVFEYSTIMPSPVDGYSQFFLLYWNIVIYVSLCTFTEVSMPQHGITLLAYALVIR